MYIKGVSSFITLNSAKLLRINTCGTLSLSLSLLMHFLKCMKISITSSQLFIFLRAKSGSWNDVAIDVIRYMISDRAGVADPYL